ncbi:unnamed protein product [Arabis nemorensis]|uniref:Pentacotripeptide-repeat region of PRORP domain-containing protein n=1 Tax=Arabis nemorensis TaxID=586526 RepID=A0A565ASU5_9BRAS|nr:unnamed protein product [Arabis nemorensis]
MAPLFENQYKLLARAGNRMQEIIVEASLSKEEMKSTIIFMRDAIGQVIEAECIFNQMKMAGCKPDVIAYTSMLHAYNASGIYHEGMAVKNCNKMFSMDLNSLGMVLFPQKSGKRLVNSFWKWKQMESIQILLRVQL